MLEAQPSKIIETLIMSMATFNRDYLYMVEKGNSVNHALIIFHSLDKGEDRRFFALFASTERMSVRLS